jgi:coenzyme F420-reducing hydrogenase beta subunit
MILAQKVVRQDGVLLAQKGAALTEPVLRMLERLNFEAVSVEVESTETAEEKASRISREEEELQARFSKVESDPILASLKAALLERLHEED